MEHDFETTRAGAIKRCLPAYLHFYLVGWLGPNAMSLRARTYLDNFFAKFGLYMSI